MNNFYASVECMLNPELKNKCLAVGGSVEDRSGIILAKNYNAKAYGVKTGETIWEAKQKCKDLVVVPPNYDEYIRFSNKAREIYLRYTDRVEPYGMDECWMDVTGCEIYGTGEEIAEKIRSTIKFELGLTVSIGVSFNKIFAKLGSDMKKPDAITVIKRESFKEQLWNLPVSELLGVGRATNKVLYKHGVYTIGELANTNDRLLQCELGINGLKLKRFANGLDTSHVMPTNQSILMKSIGHGITTVCDLENSAEVWYVILALMQDVGTKLRKHKKKATGVAVSIKNNELITKEWQCKLSVPTESSTILSKSAFELFHKNYSWDLDIRSVSVRAIGLVEDSVPIQVDMFTNIKAIEKQENLDKAIEDIRRRFGKESIKNAVLFKDTKLPKCLDTGIILPTGMV